MRQQDCNGTGKGPRADPRRTLKRRVEDLAETLEAPALTETKKSRPGHRETTSGSPRGHQAETMTSPRKGQPSKSPASGPQETVTGLRGDLEETCNEPDREAGPDPPPA
ncbi:hypothetical protein GCM10023160_18770 [Brachybacterium paraconglomeratum]|uniref:hypothetical protein n=1 Tax=Brachybacterium paraconglomeratum TaxID=173362 RepID=UPI0031EF4659